jgi:bifunctional non-homologous end joining protein LigD
VWVHRGCLPTNGRAVPTGTQWAYEIKHDGLRFLCWRAGDRVRVFSRQGNDWTDWVPLIAEALQALPVKSVIIDWEGVVCGPDGVADFNMLRTAISRKGCREVFLYAFDLLELDGQDLRREPWETRRVTLANLLRKSSEGIRFSEHLDDADGDLVFRHACAMGLEGIVAKRRDRSYQSGRCADWIKVKNPEHPARARAELIVFEQTAAAKRVIEG